MGISISYWTVQSPSQRVIDETRSDAARINVTRAWWTEGFSFFEWPGHEGKLAGDTKVASMSRALRGVVIDEDDEAFMRARDVKFIVQQLSRWSAQYAVEWEVCCFEPCGFIISGIADNGVNEVVAGFCETGGISSSMSEAEIESRAVIIDQRFAKRDSMRVAR